jgi:hypothetical protein
MAGVASHTMSIRHNDFRLLLSLRTWKPPGQAEEGHPGAVRLGHLPAPNSSAEV